MLKMAGLASALVMGLLLSACEGGKEVSVATGMQAGGLPEGVTFVERVEADSGKIVIPYEKYVLDNGLTVILHEDKSDPLVHVDVTYHVGSGREEPGKSGFAHFFEHMMFQGSEHVADEEHFKLVTEAGGTMNGSTSADRTNYYQTVPSNQLDTVLWLEADRMGFLLNAVTQKKFENQRETVKNERGQNVDNRPYARRSERIAEALFPVGHPYSWPTIGFIEDLNRVNVNDLKKFFLRWYGPNNATLTVGGNIDKAEALAKIKKYFAAIPSGPEVLMPEKPVVTLSEDRYVSMEDNVHLPLVQMEFPTVHARHPDEAPLDVLAEILGGGKTSLIYKNLIKNQLAVQAQVNHPCRELACSFKLLALPHPASGKSLADMENIIRATIDEFESRGVEEDDLAKVKAKMEAQFIFGLQSVSGKVSQLASYETYTGNPNWIAYDVERYSSVSREDVMRVFNQYIRGKHAVVMSVVPMGAIETIAREDTFVRPGRSFDEQSNTSSDDLLTREVGEEDFDRSQKPLAGVAPGVSIPEFWRETSANGIEILGTKNFETPTSSLLLKIPGGHYYEPAEKSGLASLTAALMNESTANYSTEEMSKALQLLGSSISIGSNSRYTSVFVNSLTKNLEPTLALLKEKLFSPAFTEEDFNRLKQQRIQNILSQKKNAGYLASRAYTNLLYADTIAAMPGSGTEGTLKALSLDDVKDHYKKFFQAKNSQLIMVSDLDRKPLIASVQKVLGHWQGELPALSLDLPVNPVEDTIIYLLDKKDAPQSEIRIGKRSLPRDYTGNFYRTNLMNYGLGGHFNSRLNLNLREEKGYTYGAWSRFSGGKISGSFTASASVRADITLEALKEFIKELDIYQREGIRDDELIYMRSAINQRDALKYETPNAKLGFLGSILEYNLPVDFVRKQKQIVDSISKEEINRLARKELKLDDMIIIVVGDAVTLRPELETLGFPIVDIAI